MTPAWPSLSPAAADAVRIAYGCLLIATLVWVAPHARRYFVSERWGGYAQRGAWIEWLHNPVALPFILGLWLLTGVALVMGRAVIAAAFVNVLLCHYFFIQMRWKGVLRGMGAPGFITYWLGVAVLLVEYTRRVAPDLHGLAVLVLQLDFAAIMLSAGFYKYSAGYRHNEGMELGLVNPEWGYWWRSWRGTRPSGWWFRLFNELAWGTEVAAGLLMVVPATRPIGGALIFLSFAFIATQIRLAWLCEMVMVCCLLFIPAGGAVDGWLLSLAPGAPPAIVTASPPWVHGLVVVALWGYLLLLPFARMGLAYNFHAKRTLPRWLQPVLEAYTNVFGLIIWRVFSADITNFFVQIFEERPDGARRLVSRWGRSLRYSQVAEAITVTSLFTTLKYYPSNTGLFTTRLLRYARTVPRDADSRLVFHYMGIRKRGDAFEFVPAAEYTVDAGTQSVSERSLDQDIHVSRPAAASPVHEGIRPGSYVPLER